MKQNSTNKILYAIATIFYLISAFFLYKGYDKMMNYYNSEHSWEETVNAYVGGDAYNYIINGNYATGFFVIAIGFLIAGTLFIFGGLFVTKYDRLLAEQARLAENSMNSELPNLSDNLPEL